jgi:DNA helicase-2/ATP-dependent DNA helicase PcrA
MQAILQTLNAEQRAAVTTTEGPLLVLAGAGSGKTRVITVRIAYLLHRGVAPENVLAMTFTNKAAKEMRERVGGLLGMGTARKRPAAKGAAATSTADDLTVGTFHAFCVKLLRARAAEAGLSPNFSICDASDQQAALRGALRELRIPEAAMAPAALHGRISLLKNQGQSADAFLEAAADPRDELIGRAWKRYDEHLARARSVDFDDLLLRAGRLLRTSADARESLEKRFRYVMVDEYQDTNGPQYDVVRAIAGRHKNLCVVGDDDQSIYGWRGADVKKILAFDGDFPGARVVRLETNYRSTKEILDAANRVIGHNPGRLGKTLRAALGAGEPIATLRMEDEVAEADHAAREIAELVRVKRNKFSDFAILFRTATQPRPFEQQLRARNVPYVLTGGMSFFDRKEVRDVLSYLRLAQNPRDEVSLLRIVNAPPRGVGKSTVERIVAFATEHGISACEAFERAKEVEGVPESAAYAVAALLEKLTRFGAESSGGDLVAWLRRLVEAVDYRAEVDRCYPEPSAAEDRWSSVVEVFDMAENFARRSKKPTLTGFLEALTLSAEDDRTDEQKEKRDAVALMTIHAAKGLEFPRVYLVGVEEGLLPHQRSVIEDTVEEERRLMYVAITRARQHLSVSCTKSRSKFGTRVDSQPSRFFYEMLGEKPPKGWIPCDARSSDEKKADAEAGRPDPRAKAIAAHKRAAKKAAKKGPPRSIRRGV